MRKTIHEALLPDRIPQLTKQVRQLFVAGIVGGILQDEDQDQIEENGGCCGLSAVEDARRVAEKIGIPHYVLNLVGGILLQYREIVFRCLVELSHIPVETCVIDPFVEEYLRGRTPNPCILCNRYVKWEALLRRSMEIGADYIATGHYARIIQLDNNRYAVRKSVTAKKDQTYALYNLTGCHSPDGLFETAPYLSILHFLDHTCLACVGIPDLCSHFQWLCNILNCHGDNMNSVTVVIYPHIPII